MPTNPPQGASRSIQTLPLFPLGTVLVPGMPLSLHIFEPRYRQLVADLLADGPRREPCFGVVALRRGSEVGELGDVHDVGTTALVTEWEAQPDGRYELLAIGRQRFAITALHTTAQPYLTATVHFLPEAGGDPSQHLIAAVRQQWQTHVLALGTLAGLEPVQVEAELTAQELSYAVAQLPTLTVSDRQVLLACPDTVARLNAASRILRRETVLLRRLQALPARAALFAAQPSNC